MSKHTPELTNNQTKIDKITEQLLLYKRPFTLELKPTNPPRLRRMPRGNRCPIDMWHSHTTYIIDPKRCKYPYILFTATQHNNPSSTTEAHIYQTPIKTNWWINIETNQVCYDASSLLQTHIERDHMKNFIFAFTDTKTNTISYL